MLTSAIGLFFCSLLIAFQQSAFAGSLQIIKVGVLTKGNIERTLTMWPPTVEDYLSSAIPDCKFILVPLGFNEIGKSVKNAEIDFVLTNSASYVELESLYGVGRIATLKNLWRDDIFTTMFGAVIFTKNDRVDIRNLNDIAGKRFAAVNARAFGGWSMAWYEFLSKGIEPKNDFKQLHFSGSHQAVVEDVLSGTVDAGTVRTGVLEDMAREGIIDSSIIRVIPANEDNSNPRSGEFPFIHSTALYPEWPFSKLAHTDQRLAERVAVALLSMPEQHPAAIASHSAGWTVPLNYEPVHKLMRLLKIGPYEHSSELNFTAVINKFWRLFVTAIILICSLIIFTLYVVKLNKINRKANLALESEVRERINTALVLSQSEERFRNLVETTNDLVWEVNSENNITYISPQIQRILGCDSFSKSDLGGKNKFNLLPSELIQKKQAFTSKEMQRKHIDGRTITLECSGVPFFDANNHFLGFRGISRDITTRKITSQALQREKERAQVTLESITDGVIRTNENGVVEYINPAAAKLIACSIKETLGRPLTEVFSVVSNETHQIVNIPYEEVIRSNTNQVIPGDNYLIQRNSMHHAQVEISIAPMHNHEGIAMGTVIVFHDISEIQRLTKEMAHQASHDSLTNLYNRSEFESRLNKVLFTERNQINHVVCYMDIDQFKVVNDTCGHLAGDALLQQLSQHMQIAILNNGIIARLGGDEFGVLLINCDRQSATMVIGNLCKRIADFRFKWDEKFFQVGISVGLVEVTENAGSVTDVLGAADTACYIAKEQGRNRMHWFQQDDAAIAQHQGQMQWVNRIKHALDQNRFVLYCEEFIPLKNDADHPQHFETLIRMVDEDGKLIPPIHFIPAAERFHMMPMIDRWVLSRTFDCLSKKNTPRRQSSTHHDTTIFTINLSGQTLSDTKFLQFAIEQFERTGVNPHLICFEITETAAIANLNYAVNLMTTMKEMGCLFALDDFGSGLSSFAYLKNLPLDYLKIDGGFVSNMLDERVDFAMVDSINQIGQLIGLQTIAECVENQSVLEAARMLGIDYAQGHGIADIVPIEKVVDNKIQETNTLVTVSNDIYEPSAS